MKSSKQHTVCDSNRAKVLVIRLSAMGDVAMTVPVLEAFRRSNPQVDIVVMTRPFFQPFFRSVEGVQFITPDFNGRHKGLVGIVRLWRDVSACGVTHVADMHDVLRTKILRQFLRFSGKKLAIMDKGRAEKRALTRKYSKHKEQLTQSVERYREVLMRLGFEVAELAPVQREQLAVPSQITEIAGEKGDGVWIGIAPFAQHVGKIYPTQQSDELIGMLAGRYERVFIFGGGGYEKEFAETMECRHQGVVSVIGKAKLGEELDLMSNLDVVVSMDSSSMHMASLVGTPVVSIWGATHPFAGFYGFGQDPANAVELDLACRPCSVYGNKRCAFGDYRCLHRIPAKMVYNRVVAVVEQGSGDKKSGEKL